MLSERLEEQVQDLKSHPHISNMQVLNQFSIKMTYNPCQTTSVYKDKIYGLLITLPVTYPEDPPTLKFMDTIYHLNINYQSGQVRMAILQQDWSPFLSLTSIIQSLDHIMEEPEELCPYASQILHQYENNRQNYLNKVLGSVQYSIQGQLCASGQNQIDYGAEAEIQQNERGNKDFQIANKSSILVQQLRQSMMEIQLGGSPPKKNIVKNKKNESSNIKQSFIIQQKQRNGNASKQIGKQEKSQNKASNLIKSPRNNYSTGHKNAALHNINETINIFIQEIQQIQEQISKAKTPAIKTILKARQDSQFQMMKEVVQISENIKKGLVRKIRQDVNKN